ncbi:MAG: cyclic nucleotide-binding domain-containing protein [Defluviitaleaceae bacterium]|nr:cyclic nucleotide-binding domain-containing protein [Defluviitaleaceae bacterium]
MEIPGMPSIGAIWKEAGATSQTAHLSNIDGDIKSFSNGEIIVREGDPPTNTMYFVISGSVNIYKAYGKSKEVLLAVLGPDSFFGEMSLFLGEYRSTTVTANGHAMIVEVNKEDMYKSMAANPSLAYSMVTTLCSRLKNMLLMLDAC